MASTDAPVAAQSAERPRLDPRDKVTITVLLLSAFVVILNETAMNVALDAIIDDLGITERLAQWLTTGFLLTMAVVIPITGWLQQRLTTRQTYALAMGLFVLGTLVAAASFGFWMLLAGRIVQAAGTAIVFPLMMKTVMDLVPPGLRGLVMGNVSMVIACAPALGPTLSGVILQQLHWRFVFIVVLPIAIGFAVVGLSRLSDVNEVVAARLDWPSVPLAALGFGGSVYALSLIGDAAAPAWELPLAAVVGVAALVAFVLRQRVLQRTDDALLDLRTFRYALFTRSLLVMAIAMMAMFGSIIALPLVLQRALGLDPLLVGLVTLPGALLMGLLGPVVGRIYDRRGPRVLLVPGSLVVLAALVGFATLLSVDTPLWMVLALHVTMSLGFAATFPVLFTVALGSVPRRLYGSGSAMVSTLQQVAGAAGTALFVTVLASQSAALQAAGTPFDEAFVQGARVAFLGGAIVWVAGILLATTVRRPDDVVVDRDHPAEEAPAV
ncbi:MDR family MFS transporter [Agrococcus sp. SGAir0287]|uniref:MDR family MFS transporter n=1 Tax=Agrococcus sp. SGAir0287 TaxID=2070347 RepID=UPI0010CD1256|nr:MDR family MFS transporter [Agrococcus sp. SGAir0287]QCR20660.1 MFS transporter [Agrococcus sp. SGAir0287]